MLTLQIHRLAVFACRRRHRPCPCPTHLHRRRGRDVALPECLRWHRSRLACRLARALGIDAAPRRFWWEELLGIRCPSIYVVLSFPIVARYQGSTI